ncbi:L-selectin-like isoform X2 [Alosa alosa]|uniref:L-selectin-like isoform X2 n=1 Tax=Alosa alosa TaxID=278164 RepID=UPI00201530A0|nr:L-selectin-like isoform X2 [Alosa alosa]
MRSWIFHQRPSMVTVALGITFIAISNDLLLSRMGVQAWTYNYTTDPPLNWESARRYCKEHFTDIVAIQNKAEIAYLNEALPRNQGYYWIGIRKVQEKWTWVGTNKVLTPEAENWATGEPNDLGDGQDCVEIYIKREIDMAQWNDENCGKKKGAICYTASCSEESCSQFGECVETIGDFKCRCYLGFEGPRCERAVVCGPVQPPEQGSVGCLHAFGENSYNSSCQVRCNAGFQLQGAAQLLCLATRQWDQQTPSCQAVKCPAVSDAPSGGGLNCSHPIAPYSFNSTCEFRCDEGFLLQGAKRTECDATGQWTHPAPTCKVVRCEQLKAPSNGKLKCQDPLEKSSYNSTCWSECDSGFILKGNNSTFCSIRGQWSHALPICQAVECPAVSDAPSGEGMNCSHPIAPYSFNSTCEFRCDEAFLLQGAKRTECDATGQWTHPAPTCKVRERSLGAALLMYTAVGAASALGLLGLIGVGLLVRRMAKKASSSKGETLWNTGINPVFEDS